jgi:hypothetical protein
MHSNNESTAGNEENANNQDKDQEEVIAQAQKERGETIS